MSVAKLLFRTLGMLVLGALLVFAFAPFDRAMLVLVPLVLMLFACRELSPGAAFRRVWWFGIGYFVTAIYWIYFSMHVYYGIHVVAVLAMIFGLAAWLALFPALAMYLTRRLAKPVAGGGWTPAAVLVLFPALWVLGEMLRGWLLSGFPWQTIGYSQVDTLLRGIAPLFGVYGVSAAVLLLAAVYYLLLAAVYKRSPRVFYSLVGVYTLAALLGWNWLAIILLSAGLAWGLYQRNRVVFAGIGVLLSAYFSTLVPYSHKSGAALDVAVVQGNVHQSIKWSQAGLRQSIQRYLSLSRPHWKADLVVWPETAIPEFLGLLRESLIRPLQQGMLAAGNATLLMGVPVSAKNVGAPVDSQAAYNSVIKLTAKDLQRYDKKHLVPFGEFMPFADLLGDVYRALGLEQENFVPGDPQQRPLYINGHETGVYICYEIIFGHQVSRALPDAAFLINFSNNAWFYDPPENRSAVPRQQGLQRSRPVRGEPGLRILFSAWFGDSLEAYQHLQIVRMRALETSRYLISTTNDGITALIDSRGRVVEALPRFRQGVLRVRLQPLQGATPYVLTGDYLLLLLALGAVFLFIRSAGKHKIQA